jgi:hypothetical protein
MAKQIYTFTVNKEAEIEEKRLEKYQEGGVEKERSIVEKVKKLLPVEVRVNEPNRRQIQRGELLYSVEMSESIKAGILTKAMLINKYQDNGGLASKSDTDDLAKKYKEYESVQNDIIQLNLNSDEEGEEERKNLISDKESKLMSLRKEIIQRETSFIELFSHTADVRAQNKLLSWYALSLVEFKDPSDKKNQDFQPLFKGENFEEKEESLTRLEEQNDELFNKINPLLSPIIGHWFFSGKAGKGEFDKLLEEYGLFEESKKQEEPEAAPVEAAAPTPPQESPKAEVVNPEPSNVG